MKRTYPTFLKYFIIIFFFLNTVLLFSSTLSKQERKWIENNKVSIGVTDLYPLTYINKDKERDGFASDILQLIINKYNIKTKTLVVRQGTLFSSFKTGEIDVIPLISQAKIKSSFGLYSTEILQIKKILFVKKEENDIQSLDDLKHKKVAIIQEKENITKKNNTNASFEIIQTKNMQDSVQLLLEGKVDAIMASPIIIQTYLEDNLIIGLKAMPLIIFEPSNLYFFTNNKKPILHAILDKGLNSLTVKEKKELFDKWFLRDLANLPLKLNNEELLHLQNKKHINMCADPDWMPYEKILNHKHIGMVADYMKIFEKRIGIPIKLIETKNWTQSLEYMKNKTCDILSLAMVTKNRQEYMNFTKAYIMAPLVLVTKKNITFISDLKTLKHKKIGVQKDFAYNEKLRRLYPEMNIVDVEHLHTGLQKVEKGELFGQVSTHLNVAYAFQKDFFGSLQISGKFDESWKLSIGVRNDDVILFNIFEKVIDSISDETRQKIINSWVSIKYEQGFNYKLLWKILAFFVFIWLLITYTYVMQRKYIHKLKKVKEEIEVLNDTLERKVEVRTKELKLSNKKLKLKTLELEDLNNTLDARIKEEINIRKKQEQLLIQQSKLAEMGEMISMIAHQWRQPLSALSTVFQNVHLRYSLGKLNQEYLNKQLTLSNALTRKMSTTIDDFRNFFQPNKEKIEFSVQAAIQQTVFLIDDSFKNYSIKITNIACKDVILYGFESELSQVLLNLLTNSKDAFIETEVKNPLIQIKSSKKDENIEIIITDNAGGIKQDLIDKIFDPYFTTKESYNGTGLGLYMSKMIIEQNMHGELSVRNLEKGVEFSILIPINKN
ncbi:MAG: hypothetical protein COA66_07290 [Arcobacter sp.]|nr:MAG: hypothetical protein COA66_07290 [Arcobacter sp.]